MTEQVDREQSIMAMKDALQDVEYRIRFAKRTHSSPRALSALNVQRTALKELCRAWNMHEIWDNHF